MSFSHRSWVEIDRRILQQNIAALRALLEPRTQFVAVVKSNAYGHGLPLVAQAIGPFVDWFAVDSLAEASALSDTGIRKPVLLLSPPAEHEAREVVARGFHSVAYDPHTLLLLSEAGNACAQTAFVHVKLDTGMGRQGVAIKDLPRLFEILLQAPHVRVAGIMTHFANADDRSDTWSVQEQLARFSEILPSLAGMSAGEPLLRHAAASAAVLRFPETHFDAVRVGIAMYGSAPNAGFPFPQALLPTLAFRAKVIAVRDIPSGTAVGYGLSEKVRRRTRLALLPAGYADGIDRRLSSKGAVLLSGKRAKIIGRVSMGLTAVDVSDIPGVVPGDTATIIGSDGNERISVEEIAATIGTIPYEVLIHLPFSLPRIGV